MDIRALRHLLALPRGLQPAEVERLRAAAPAADAEQWNTRFGPGSLYEAWASTRLMDGVYTGNTALLRPHLDRRKGWRILEVGGGDGTLWARTLRPRDRGEIWIVDPVPEAHARVASVLPPGVRLESVVGRVEDALADLPGVDAVVCSLALHHLAGADQAERRRHGLAGPGKVEVLAALGRALQDRQGIGILNEADIYCDLGLPPGDPVLVDRILDSYVRRTVRALLDELETLPEDAVDLRARLETILQRWCLDQVAVAHVPLDRRDVYELDVPRWLDVLARAGLQVRERAFSDPYGLFCRYVFAPG